MALIGQVTVCLIIPAIHLLIVQPCRVLDGEGRADFSGKNFAGLVSVRFESLIFIFGILLAVLSHFLSH